MAILEALPKQVRHTYEKASAIASEAISKITVKLVITTVRRIIVITSVKSSSRTRIPTEKQLAVNGPINCFVVDSGTRENEPRKLISRTKRKNV